MSEKIELTKEESETYMKIVKRGDMDMMFDFGVIIGSQNLIKNLTTKNHEQ